MKRNKLLKPTRFPTLDQLKENQDIYQEELRKKILPKNKLIEMKGNDLFIKMHKISLKIKQRNTMVTRHRNLRNNASAVK